jgi:hypothetical protein
MWRYYECIARDLARRDAEFDEDALHQPGRANARQISVRTGDGEAL